MGLMSEGSGASSPPGGGGISSMSDKVEPASSYGRCATSQIIRMAGNSAALPGRQMDRLRIEPDYSRFWGRAATPAGRKTALFGESKLFYINRL